MALWSLARLEDKILKGGLGSDLFLSRIAHATNNTLEYIFLGIPP